MCPSLLALLLMTSQQAGMLLEVQHVLQQQYEDCRQLNVLAGSFVLVPSAPATAGGGGSELRAKLVLGGRAVPGEDPFCSSCSYCSSLSDCIRPPLTHLHPPGMAPGSWLLQLQTGGQITLAQVDDTSLQDLCKLDWRLVQDVCAGVCYSQHCWLIPHFTRERVGVPGT